MRPTLLAVALLLAFVSLANAKTQGPHGKYCGSYSFGLVSGTVNFDDTMMNFDLSFDGLGAHVKCTKEAYSINADGTLAVPGATASADCLGSVLNSNGLSLDVLYHHDDDTLDLDLGLASLTVKRC
jgi:hypothetical protein